MAFDRLLSDRTKHMGTNVIREILKVVSQPGMVSLAGGIPAVLPAALILVDGLPRWWCRAALRRVLSSPE